MFKYLMIFYFLSTFLLFPQEKQITISGYLFDGNSGEGMIGANIFLPELGVGTSSNEYGFYSISIPAKKTTVEFSFIGYKKEFRKISGIKSERIDVRLISKTVDLEEIIVEDKRAEQNVKSIEMGTAELKPKELEVIPIILGEQDILKTLQLMPGVSTAGEGSSGFFVRGGKVDQNLILLDEATVYNASHLLGFFSVFNSDAIKNAKIIKGSMPANYGGRLSSLLDIRMKEGNSRHWEYSGGLGLISSRLTVEGPIIKDKASFLISGRRTYADIFIPLFADEEFHDSKLYFYDLNLKSNYMIDENNRIFLSCYFGRDVFQFQDEFGFDWGNTTGTLRWNHLFSDKLFFNTSLIFSNYNYIVNVSSGDNKFRVSSGIQDFNLKTDFEYFCSSDNTIRFGYNGFYHTFSPGKIETLSGSFNSKEVPKKYGIESAFYLLQEYQLNERIRLNYGLRLTNYFNIGPGTTYKYDAESNPTDTSFYSDNEIINQFWNLEPRFSINYSLDETSSLKFSYARNNQYIHLLSTSTTSTPVDIWQPTTDIVRPETADQLALGYFKNFEKNMYETSVEFYYKDMRNLIEYKNGADIFLNEFIESQLVFGDGFSYGMELSVKKNYGEFTGWLSYTLSKTERIFSEINDGNPFSARQDRTHDVSLTGVYKLNSDWTFSANWIYYTGDAVTFPSGKYIIDGNTVNLYTERNGYRMPDYHRLDLGVTYYIAKSKEKDMSINFSVYNAYGRKNAYTIDFRETEDNPQNTEAVKLSLFSVVPSLSFNFRF